MTSSEHSVGRYGRKETSETKRSSAMRAGRFSHMEDESALVPTPDMCLCEAGPTFSVSGSHRMSTRPGA